MSAVWQASPSEPATVLDVRHGYDLAASSFAERPWFEFWRRNEGPFVVGWLSALPPGLGVDAGGGTAPYLPAIAAANHRCVLIDVSLPMLRAAEAVTQREPWIARVQGDVRSLPLRDGAADWVLCTRVLSHLPDVQGFFDEAARVVRDGGECLITDVHPEHPYAHTRVSTPSGQITIATYKHTVADVRAAAKKTRRFEIVQLAEIFVRDLAWLPPDAAFEKLSNDPTGAVFYVYRLRRAGATPGSRRQSA